MLTVLYEDNHIIVVLKPHNVPSQPDSSNDNDMLSIVRNYIKVNENKPGEAFVGMVHRLDRPTGGLMVFAKTSKAASRLSKQIAERSFEKNYYAVVVGEPKNRFKQLTHYLKKNARTNTVDVAPQTVDGAKMAQLSYNVLQSNQEHSLLNISLHTGRSHQIRVQLKTIGHPIVSDAKYGVRENGVNMSLWAYEIKFTHPTTQQQHTFKALPPADEYPWNLFNIS